MYDMYPEWGPARNREPLDTMTREKHQEFLQDALDGRDADGPQPDDN